VGKIKLTKSELSNLLENYCVDQVDESRTEEILNSEFSAHTEEQSNSDIKIRAGVYVAQRDLDSVLYGK